MAVEGAVGVIPLVASSWLNFMLYTLELVLCGFWLLRPTRPIMNRLGIVIMVLSDTICTGAICAEVVLDLVPQPEPLRFITALSIKIVTTYITAAIVQLSFSYLFFVLTKNWIVLGALVILIFVHLGFSLASAALLFKSPSLGRDSGIAFTVNTIGAATCAATDLIVAICLGYKFLKMIRRTMPGYGTRSLIRRILALSVGSGAVCATVTLLMLILLLKDSFIFNFMNAIQGRVYALSILVNYLLGLSSPGSRSSDDQQDLSRNFHFRTSVSSVVFHSTEAGQVPRPSGGTQIGVVTKSAEHRAAEHSSDSSGTSLAHGDAVRLQDLKVVSCDLKDSPL
ncbi:hypothetical protein R3P38DRAFT_824996 [Favolaschia claudopus]|uniref:DUF6534 domain-containing protein n=1 Tax=Favolaschia claudopus TaxID=2862362 RepID=A0AAW0C272_9AGAR